MKDNDAKAKNGPVGTICKQCKTKIRARDKTHTFVSNSRKLGKKVELSIETEIWFCDCGTSVWEDDFDSKRWEKYCEHEGFISPNRLKKLREYFGSYLLGKKKKRLSQERFAELLGAGVASIRRWEAGEYVPSGTHEKLIKYLEKDESRREEYWDENCREGEQIESAQVEQKDAVEAYGVFDQPGTKKLIGNLDEGQADKWTDPTAFFPTSELDQSTMQSEITTYN